MELLITAPVIRVKCTFNDNTDIPRALLFLITQLCEANVWIEFNTVTNECLATSRQGSII